MTGEAEAQAQEAVGKLAAAAEQLAAEEAIERAAQAAHEAAAREAATHVPPAPGFGAQLEALFAAGSGVIGALGRFFAEFGALLGAEARVLRTGVPLFFIACIALIALSVSLWACLVALIAWLLLHLTHSMGIALLLLVVGHALLVTGIWFAIKRGVHQASFPQARAEWRALWHQMTGDLKGFAGPRADKPAPPDTGSKP
ncbi:MAG: hypothetical protein ABI132_01505 [Rhodanobacteraceae bacterium]